MILEHLPPSVIRSLPELSLIVVGVFVELHYVSRISSFTNTTALAVHYLSLPSPGELFTLYVELGLLIGVYGFFKYVRTESIGQPFYLTTFYFYSSFTVGAIIFLPVHTFWALVAGVLMNIALEWHQGGVDNLTYSGPRPGAVAYFIQNNSIAYPDHAIGRRVRVPLSEVFEY